MKEKWPIDDIYIDDPAIRTEIKYSAVTQEQLDRLSDKIKNDPLAHYCPDWDYMMIFSDSPEMDCCLCRLKPK